MKMFIVLLTVFAANSAFADFAIDCSRQNGRNGVHLSDHSDHYNLTDKATAGVGARTLNSAGSSADTLTFLVDVGTSVKKVYQFSGLKYCWQNDYSKYVVLKVGNQMPGGKPNVIERLTCECSSD